MRRGESKPLVHHSIMIKTSLGDCCNNRELLCVSSLKEQSDKDDIILVAGMARLAIPPIQVM